MKINAPTVHTWEQLVNLVAVSRTQYISRPSQINLVVFEVMPHNNEMRSNFLSSHFEKAIGIFRVY